jgi:hypothetical protein
VVRSIGGEEQFHVFGHETVEAKLITRLALVHCRKDSIGDGSPEQNDLVDTGGSWATK